MDFFGFKSYNRKLYPRLGFFAAKSIIDESSSLGMSKSNSRYEQEKND